MARLAATTAARLSPTMARAVMQRRTLPIRRYMSSLPQHQNRPFKLNVGVGFAGKPFHLESAKSKMKTADFTRENDIVRWREETLQKYASGFTPDAGEDFFYVQEMRGNSGLSFAVADGVGGWIDSGVDPSLFSQSLMYHAHRYAKQSWAGEPEIDPLAESENEGARRFVSQELLPRKCLQLAYDAVLDESEVHAGSSTACLININAVNGKLRAVNLGDSGFCIIRSSNVFHVQPPQQHYFNCPRQLSKHPEMTQDKVSRHEATDYLMDYPSEADAYETALRHGDIVIAYTDGFSDNVFMEETAQICSLVSRHDAGDSEETRAQNIAKGLIKYARACMHDRSRSSPFSVEARKHRVSHRGGKVDEYAFYAHQLRQCADDILTASL